MAEGLSALVLRLIDSSDPPSSPSHSSGFPFVQGCSLRIHPCVVSIDPAILNQPVRKLIPYEVREDLPSSDSTTVQEASRSFLQSSVSTNAHPGSSVNVRLLLYTISMFLNRSTRAKNQSQQIELMNTRGPGFRRDKFRGNYTNLTSPSPPLPFPIPELFPSELLELLQPSRPRVQPFRSYGRRCALENTCVPLGPGPSRSFSQSSTSFKTLFK